MSRVAHLRSSASILPAPSRKTPFVCRYSPLALATAAALLSIAGHAQAATPTTGAWFATAAADRAAAGRVRPGLAAHPEMGTAAVRQQAAARAVLATSINNLERTAAAIAAQQAAQQAARQAAQNAAHNVVDGLAVGGLWDRDTDGNLLSWQGAERAQQQRDGSHVEVSINQTDDKALLNWTSFNVGANTRVTFNQDSGDAVLNRVVGAGTDPSRILGTINGAGTVMVVNQNGVIFSGSSQVNVRNLVAAAATISDEQFLNRGIYGSSSSVASFRDAEGSVQVDAGAQLQTLDATSSTTDGGYVLLLGGNVSNAGQISTANGQTVLAAGDNFYIRRGVGSESNTYSTTVGNEVSTTRAETSTQGSVSNTGLITATTGDITLTGHDVRQNGVLTSTSSTLKRGTIHLSTRASDSTGQVTLGAASNTAILVDSSDASALDNQQQAALERLDGTAANDTGGVFDNLNSTADRRDLSRIEIVSGDTVTFADGSLTLATGGQLAVAAGQRIVVDDGATLDVSGAVGVAVAMASNILEINLQSNEQRDSAANNESDNLNNLTVWVDRRNLVYVPAGTNGYDTDRWYTAGGLLEVSGYLANQGHQVGEWLAQGGTITMTGGSLITRHDSSINLSGGSLDVQGGLVHQSWLRGSDGRLYEVSHAPGDLLYEGLYQGGTQRSERWGTSRAYFSPLVGADSRYMPGYTVGRDAGTLVVATTDAQLDGAIVAEVYNGEQQSQRRVPGVDGYLQSHNAVARGGQLVLGQYLPLYDSANGQLHYQLSAAGLHSVVIGDDAAADDDPSAVASGQLQLSRDWLQANPLSVLKVASDSTIRVAQALELNAGGELVLYAPSVSINADVTVHSGRLDFGDVLYQYTINGPIDTVAANLESATVPQVTIARDVTLDASGRVSDLRQGDAIEGLAYVDGGAISVRGQGDVTLADGSLLNVSAGAAVTADSVLVGGGGGDITLETGHNDNVLTLAGQLSGYGVTGGGQLSIVSDSAIVIDGQAMAVDGQLQAGEQSLVDLVLAEDYTVPAGAVLPLDYTYQSFVATPGTPLGGLVDSSTHYTLAADWALPPVDAESSFGGYTVYVYDPDSGVRINSYYVRSKTDPGITIAAGAEVSIFASNVGNSNHPIYTFSADYEVPGDVFPDGIVTSTERTIRIAAGDTFTRPLTFAAGTVIPAGHTFTDDVVVEHTTTLASSVFTSGFADYNVRGYHGLLVPDAVQLAVTMPTLQVDLNQPLSQQGVTNGDAFTVQSLPLYQADENNRTLQQRPGASLTLAAGEVAQRTAGEQFDNLGVTLGDSGPLTIGLGASVVVDPRQSLHLASRSDLTVNGRLQALGGEIVLRGPMNELNSTYSVEEGYALADGEVSQRAITIGSQAQIDVSAPSHTVTDALGRPYGTLDDAGQVFIGGLLDEQHDLVQATNAFVVIDDGALIDASGAQTRWDINGAGQLTTVASNGGTIALASANGIYLNGQLRATAGGSGAAGGTLIMALQAPLYQDRVDMDATVLALRELQLVQQAAPMAVDYQYGSARLGVDQVTAAGFDSLRLFSNGAIDFVDDIELSLKQSLALYAPVFAAVSTTAELPSGQVNLQAPHILLSGVSNGSLGTPIEGYLRPSSLVLAGGSISSATSASLQASADLLEIQSGINLGLDTVLLEQDINLPGFASTELSSRGDLRFIAGYNSAAGTYSTRLFSAGDITLRAAQVYPATGVSAEVVAGYIGGGSGLSVAGSRLVISRYDPSAPVPDLPYSVFGQLHLGAETLEQQGVVRAPLGNIILGSTHSSGATQRVHLAAGSETSISASGLILPYGGTLDGENWRYLGELVTLQQGISQNANTITLAGTVVDVAADAVLDLSGGGTLQGAGFISGAGGSSDARYVPLIQVHDDGFVLPTLTTNPVYAIIPGYDSDYAPADSSGAVSPLAGQQITIGENSVPGLAPGTYTLLPSSYALLAGAYRVELNGLTDGAGLRSNATLALNNGSYQLASTLSVANTGVRDSLRTAAIITPAAGVRRYSEYNETNYSDFVLAEAERRNYMRAWLPADAGSLQLVLPAVAEASLHFLATPDFTPGEGGNGGSAAVYSSSLGADIEVLADDAVPSADFSGLSLFARDLNHLNAAQLVLGSSLSRDRAFMAFATNGAAGSIIMRDGAELNAPSVFLVTTSSAAGISLESGSGINTLAMGDSPYDGGAGYIYNWNQSLLTVLGASNGTLTVAPTSSATVPGVAASAGGIHIGLCPALTCSAHTELYSAGTLVFATHGAFEMADTVNYGSRALQLAVDTVNIGSAETLAAATAAGTLTPGLQLNQALLDRLLQGDTEHGAPALESLHLSASDAMNFWGDVTLDTTDPQTGTPLLAQLVLHTPAIYGAGSADSTATIVTSHLIWTGSAIDAPLAPISGGRGDGSGALVINADEITLGYGPRGIPTGLDNDQHWLLGFADVTLNAAERLAANQHNTLSVYQRLTQVDAQGAHYQGGQLTVNTPLVTGAAASQVSVTAGGAIVLTAPADATTPVAETAWQQGAEWQFAAQSVRLATAIVLPSGQLVVRATDDIELTDNALLDLAGREQTLYDQTVYSWGGNVSMTSSHGAIRQAAASTIDLSATNNHAGALTLVALDEAAGLVDMRGTLRATASGHYDAAGTELPYASGQLDVRTHQLGDDDRLSEQFAAFNQRLNDNGWLGERRFQLTGGDLTIGDELMAQRINVSLDNGALTVTGRIDASGEQVGQIELAANNGVTLSGQAQLDAHGSILRVDSHGQPIEAGNRAVIRLDSGNGLLTLAAGATLDVRYGTDNDDNDTAPLGVIALVAPRIDAAGAVQTSAAATYGDIAIAATDPLTVNGAATIALYGRYRYDDAPLGTTPQANGQPYQLITQDYLDDKDAEARAFINNSLANTALINDKLAGLRAYTKAFHLRPAVEIASVDPDHDLVVQGDLDLSGYRYASLNSTTALSEAYGSGEVGLLTLRSGRDLAFYGSLNDGFAPPVATPDDIGWVLVPGTLDAPQSIGISGVTLASGTQYAQGVTLNYDIVANQVTLPAGTRLPMTLSIENELSLPAGTVLSADVLGADGTVLLAAGTLVPDAGLVLDAGSQLAAGTVLPTALTVSELSWPAGEALPVAMRQGHDLVLPLGALLPAGTNVVLPDEAIYVDLRPMNNAGASAVSNWAVAEMLPAGSLSWDVQLVAGAAPGAADHRLTKDYLANNSVGSVHFADTHYAVEQQWVTPETSVMYWSYDNVLGQVGGTPVPDFYLDMGICDMSPVSCVAVSWVWADNNPLGQVGGSPVPDMYLDMGICDMFPAACVFLGGSGEPELVAVSPVTQGLSVVRTGSGDLDIAAAADVTLHSPYGVYTAGTATSLGSDALDAAYDQPRGAINNGLVIGGHSDYASDYEALVRGDEQVYHAWYPDHGGNLNLRIGGDLGGYVLAEDTYRDVGSGSVSNWLWRQGTGDTVDIDGVPTAWWINFGSYAHTRTAISDDAPDAALAVGFTGFGALGGGNVRVTVGGDAGQLTANPTNNANYGEGLVLAVGSTGRVLADGSLVLTGGGDLNLQIAGGWNNRVAARVYHVGSTPRQTQELYGSLINLRGDLSVEASQVGTMEYVYSQDSRELRQRDNLRAETTYSSGGLFVVSGDSTARVNTRGTMVFAGSGDPGLAPALNYVPYHGAYNGEAGQSWFSLWSDNTALNLFSAGGDLTFDTRLSQMRTRPIFNQGVSDLSLSGSSWLLLPGNVSVVAPGGDIYTGSSAYFGLYHLGTKLDPVGLLQAPLGARQLDLLAGGSIYAGGYFIASSGANSAATATISHPGFIGSATAPIRNNDSYYVDVSNSPLTISANELFAFGANTLADDVGMSLLAPSHFYAARGDIVGLQTGAVIIYAAQAVEGGSFAGSRDYVAAGPVQLRAAGDIVYTGTLADEAEADRFYGESTINHGVIHGDLIANTTANDVSLLAAGGNIYYANVEVVGPGTLWVSANGSIIQNSLASLNSLGTVVGGDQRPGANLVVTAGLGSTGPDYYHFLQTYLDAENQADSDLPLADQPGKVVQIYDTALVDWLAEHYDFSGDAAAAISYLDSLPEDQQRLFALQVYFDELRAGGREYNDQDGPRPGSYLRGRNAIATLFPVDEHEDGSESSPYRGDLVMYGDAGIHTDGGGDIWLLTPGGSQTYGLEGEDPAGSAGVITRGEGNIQLYSQGSILLGQSRIMTTYGGDILAWSATGDINAGRGAKTTIVYTPPRRVYDDVGNTTLSPQVPSSGAGIATLNPVPEVAPGDIDLYAPEGTIDAGEAGIRVSGNVNIAAQHVVNAANIQVQGDAVGIPVIATVNTSALTAASSAASSATQAADQVVKEQQQAARENRPSVISVQILGFGDNEDFELKGISN